MKTSRQQPTAKSYLDGLDLPASKLEVIAAAEAGGAPQEVLEALQRMKVECVESHAALEEHLARPS